MNVLARRTLVMLVLPLALSACNTVDMARSKSAPPEDCNHKGGSTCTFTVHYDKATRTVSVTPDVLVVHFQGHPGTTVPIHWTIDRSSIGEIEFRPPTSVAFKNLDPIGPFGTPLGDFRERLGGASAISVPNTCGSKCNEGETYWFKLYVYDRQGKALETPDPGITNRNY
ncbi:MAG: hypothetical protein JSR18_04295 [Proteobacteria bacterium]|nr:hypothetical protein [Pseudomonadota bacterium]